MFKMSRTCALALTIGLAASPSYAAVDLVTRTPNIAPLELAAPGSADFVFNHRLSSLSPVSAWPTLYLDVGVLPWLSVYSTYASKGYSAGPAGQSPVQGAHDLGIALRQAILTQDGGGLWPDAPLSVTLSEGVSTVGLESDAGAPWYSGYLVSNSAQESLGISVGRTLGRLGLVGTVRSVAYQWAYVDNVLVPTPGIRTSGTVGATFKLNDGLALAGDWGKYVDQLAGIPAWSAALQGKLPGSQHLLALEVSNVPTNTLGGTAQSAASAGDLFVGFAFSASLRPRLLKVLVPDFLAPPAESERESAAGVAGAPDGAEPAAAAPSASGPVAGPAGEAGSVTSGGVPVPGAGSAPAAESAAASILGSAAPTATGSASGSAAGSATAPGLVPAPPPAGPPPRADAAALKSRGKKLFDSDAAGQGCVACHEARDLAGTGIAALRGAFKSDSMSDFKGLKEADLKALEAYLKSLKK